VLDSGVVWGGPKREGKMVKGEWLPTPLPPLQGFRMLTLPHTNLTPHVAPAPPHPPTPHTPGCVYHVSPISHLVTHIHTPSLPPSAALQGDSVTVLDALMFKRGMAVRSLSHLYQKAQLQLMKFEHVDMQYIPRWGALGAGCMCGVLGDEGLRGAEMRSVCDLQTNTDCRQD